MTSTQWTYRDRRSKCKDNPQWLYTYSCSIHTHTNTKEKVSFACLSQANVTSFVAVILNMSQKVKFSQGYISLLLVGVCHSFSLFQLPVP